MIRKLFFLMFFMLPVLAGSDFFAQPVKQYSSAQIRESLNRLKVLGTILYVAAHPDDENTAFLAYSVKQRHLRTAYLSLTRGEGGQNLIGEQQGAELGMIRTHELLAARRIDGAEQYFTRAIDFGYSKTPVETLKKWDREKVLSDIVYIIRKLKPDVIVTRFPPTGEGGHGHHTSSAILAEEAYKVSGDKNKFADQITLVEPFKAKRLYFNGWLQIFLNRGTDTSGLIKVDLGEYNRLEGRSYNEIAAQSRSMHKSQGFGSTPQRGRSLNYFGFVAGDSAAADLFSGIDISWNRIGAGYIGPMIDAIISRFSDENPSSSIPALTEVYKKVSSLPAGHYRDLKLAELAEVIRACAGIWLEVITDKETYSAGDTVKLTAQALNRSAYAIKLNSVKMPDGKLTGKSSSLAYNTPYSVIHQIVIDTRFQNTNPHWLNDENAGLSHLRGEADNRTFEDAEFQLSIDNVDIQLKIPVHFRKNDPVEGEVYFDPVILPAISITPSGDVIYFVPGKAEKVRAEVKFIDACGSVEIIPELPVGWKCSPEKQSISAGKPGESVTVIFEITPPVTEGKEKIKFSAVCDGRKSSVSVRRIVYTHIPLITYLATSEITAVSADIKSSELKVGYIEGAGDKVAQFVSDAGCGVENLTPSAIEAGGLNRFNSILTGVRAFNTNKQAAKQFDKILNYVKEGGVLVIQYNTNQELAADSLGPFPFKLSRDRVAEEESEVRILKSGHPLLNSPNKITEADFSGWVQERGLYFPSGYNPAQYDELLSMNDTGEKPLNSAILYTKYGKGVFIYTSLSLFRQIPAGVPGALKLLINLLSAG